MVGWLVWRKKENLESKEVNESLASHRPTIDVHLNRAVDLKLLSYVVRSVFSVPLNAACCVCKTRDFLDLIINKRNQIAIFVAL